MMAQPAYAYIDPGTGSMLFSVVVCSITTLLFLFHSLFLKLKFLPFFAKNNNSKKLEFVIYSEGNQYYPVFKPVLDEFEARKISVTYYTSAENDLLFEEKYEYINREFIGKGNKAYFKLAFLNADICLMTTPQLDVLQLRRSKNVKHYSHILHSIGFDMMYRLFSLDYYDSVLCDAEYQVSMIREIEKKRNLSPKKLPVVGSTYMDFKKKQLPERNNKSKFSVLLAPSWGKDSLLNKYGEKFLNKFIDGDFDIVVRPHPQSLIVEKDLIESLQERYKKYTNITWDFSSNNLIAMANSDILISDFSCIMCDYAFLFNKPFLYIDTNINYEKYDNSELDNYEQYLFSKKIGTKLNMEDSDCQDIVKIVNTVVNDKQLLEKIQETSSFVWQCRGEAAKNVVDFLVETQKEVSNK